MNNTLEEINRRITEAKEQISGLEDRMVEITAAEQNIEKIRMKSRQPILNNRLGQTSGTALNAPTFALQGSQKEKRERKRT